MISFSEFGYSRPLIHVGYPKCLSTWLQNNLFTDANGFWRLMGPFEIRNKIVDPAPFCYRPEKVKNWIAQNLHDDKSLLPVITSEGISGNMRHGGYNAEELSHRIKATFAEPRILVVIREQKKLIRSLYSEVVKWGMPHSLEHFLVPNRPRLAPQHRVEFLQFHALVGEYFRLYGRENVLVLPFELFTKRPTEFIASVADFVELSEPYKKACLGLNFKKRSNTSFSLTNIHYQRFYNRWFVANAYNYTCLFRETEKDIWKRDLYMIRREKRLPGLFNNLLERRFKEKVKRIVGDSYKASNAQLQSMVNFDLGEFGYDM